MKDKVIAIIPARGGSKGLVGKNIKILNGKPLIAYTIQEALKSQYIERVIVSTDDPKIAEIGKEYGADVPFMRPEELAGDQIGSVDVLIHALDYLKHIENKEYPYTCLLQCTTPFKTAEDIDKTIEKCIDSQMFDASVSLCEAEVNPLWTVKLEQDLLVDFIKGGNDIPMRQELPKAYRLNGGIYVIDTEVLMSTRNLLPEKTTGYIMESIRSIDIDTEYDFKLCEFIGSQIL